MTAAPPFACRRCGRQIGPRSEHVLTDAGLVVCAWCTDVRAHRDLYPDCAAGWRHDVLDHLDCTGNRAAIAARLGALTPGRD